MTVGATPPPPYHRDAPVSLSNDPPQAGAKLARKMETLAPAIEAAFARKRELAARIGPEIPTYEAYGLLVAEVDVSKMPEANRRRFLAFRKMREIAERT
jgi:hypothetical protein